MTAFGKLLRTTAFRLTLVYLAVFALFAAFVLAYFSWNTRRLITEQITETVDTEIRGLTEQYGQGGIRRLVFAIDSSAVRPGSNLYLLTTPAGEGLAGNIGSLTAGVGLSPAGRCGSGGASRAGAARSAPGRISAPGRPRSRGARTYAGRHIRRRPVVAGDSGRARHRRRSVRDAARAQARRRHDRDDAHD